MDKKYHYPNPFEPDSTTQVRIRKGQYTRGGIAVQLTEEVNDPECPYEQPFATLTVRLPETGLLPNPDTDAFIDTNNNPEAGRFLKENGLATPIGITATSGMCRYPAYRFSKEVLESPDII